MGVGQILCVSFFPFWYWGWDVGCDCINSWSLPFYLLCSFEIFTFLRRNPIMLFPFLIAWSMCWFHERLDLIPIQGTWWCHKSRGHVLSKYNGFPLGSWILLPQCTAFVRVKGHAPLLFPPRQTIKILLQLFTVKLEFYLSIQFTVIRGEPGWWLDTVWKVIYINEKQQWS